ncbi:MAG: hypothetical protein JWO08_3901 [Verrucomicrobiaceae bacterium]|nr:hypothetical protein [Verrucomicrobiaceae bacterium]
MNCRLMLMLGCVWTMGCLVQAKDKTIRVFVALCDNATQGIIPVPPKIGNGDDLDNNLYWGCDEGLRSVFRKSSDWKRVKQQKPASGPVLERLEFTHTSGTLLVAEAYRGSQMKQCLLDCETAIRTGEHDLVAFIGHNGLMDQRLEVVPASPVRRSDVIVLCCKSAEYFQDRIKAQGGRPVLLTTQLMYPGSFLLRDALASWMKGGSPGSMRDAAARAYAKNQGISVKAAAGVFADLEHETPTR